MSEVVFMGSFGLHYFMASFVTFESEIGYEECVKMKQIQFGEDILRVEPSQHRGSMPTSVLFWRVVVS